MRGISDAKPTDAELKKEPKKPASKGAVKGHVGVKKMKISSRDKAIIKVKSKGGHRKEH